MIDSFECRWTLIWRIPFLSADSADSIACCECLNTSSVFSRGSTFNFHSNFPRRDFGCFLSNTVPKDAGIHITFGHSPRGGRWVLCEFIRLLDAKARNEFIMTQCRRRHDLSLIGLTLAFKIAECSQHVSCR